MALPNWQRTITTTTGDVVPGAEVEVVDEATGLTADLYTSRAGTSAKSNPFFADSSGFAEFYADPGEYRITATGAAGSQTWRYEVLSGTAAMMTNDTGGSSLGSAAAMTNNTGGDRLLQEIVRHPLTETYGGKWVVYETPAGEYAVCYRLPAFTFDTLGIPDLPFTGLVDLFRNPDGTTKPYHDIAVYIGAKKGNEIVSQAGTVPHNRVSLDEFRQLCENAGGKSFGAYERAALLWLMVANKYQPRGNTEFGRSHEIEREFAQRQDGRVPNDRSGEARTLAGTGPASWSHDGTESGIKDMIGNQWEWCDDFKMMDGEFVVADYCGQPESEWSKTGRFIAPGHKFAMANRGDAKSSQVWSEFTKEDGYEGHELLQRLCIEPIEITRVLKGRFYYNTSGERSPHVGGSWSYGSGAGPAALYLNNPRSPRSGDIGGRLAFRA